MADLIILVSVFTLLTLCKFCSSFLLVIEEFFNSFCLLPGFQLVILSLKMSRQLEIPKTSTVTSQSMSYTFAAPRLPNGSPARGQKPPIINTSPARFGSIPDLQFGSVGWSTFVLKNC